MATQTTQTKQTGNFITRSLRWTLLLFLSTFGVIIVFGLLLGFLERLSQTYMYSAFGWAGIVITGIVGTPIHELAHYLMCLIFGYKVTEVALFRPIAGMSDGVLGYVSYQRNTENLWQTIGTLFVGIAPMILGPVILIILFRILIPEGYMEVKKDVGIGLSDDNITIGSVLKATVSTLKNVLKSLLHFTKQTAVRNIVMIYLMLAISSHTTLSTADIVNALPGFVIVFLFYLVLGVLTALTKVNIGRDIMSIALTIAAFFMVALVFSALATLISFGFYVIF